MLLRFQEVPGELKRSACGPQGGFQKGFKAFRCGIKRNWFHGASGFKGLLELQQSCRERGLVGHRKGLHGIQCILRRDLCVM